MYGNKCPFFNKKQCSKNTKTIAIHDHFLDTLKNQHPIMVSDLKYYEHLFKEWFVIFFSNQIGIYIIGVMWCIMHVKGLQLFINDGIFYVDQHYISFCYLIWSLQCLMCLEFECVVLCNVFRGVLGTFKFFLKPFTAWWDPKSLEINVL